MGPEVHTTSPSIFSLLLNKGNRNLRSLEFRPWSCHEFPSLIPLAIQWPLETFERALWPRWTKRLSDFPCYFYSMLEAIDQRFLSRLKWAWPELTKMSVSITWLIDYKSLEERPSEISSKHIHETASLPPSSAFEVIGSVPCFGVSVGLWDLRCAPPHGDRIMLCTTDLCCAPPTCVGAPSCTRGTSIKPWFMMWHPYVIVTSQHDVTTSCDVTKWRPSGERTIKYSMLGVCQCLGIFLLFCDVLLGKSDKTWSDR